MSTRKVPLTTLAELPVNGQRVFTVDGVSILLCRTAAGVFALENLCTHQLSPLQGGPMRGTHIFCPKHGARFDMRTGATSGALTKQPIRTLPVIVEGDSVAIEVPIAVCHTTAAGPEDPP